MLTLTYAQLRGPLFIQGFQKLVLCPKIKSTSAAFHVAKIHGHVVAGVELSNKLHQDLVDIYAAKTPDGKIASHDGMPNTFFIPDEVKAEWIPKYEEFLRTKIEIDGDKVDLDDVMVAELSPAEIHALEPILYFD